MPWHESVLTALGAGDPASQAERRESVSRVQAAVAGLDEHLRLPVVLREVLGLSVEETARSLGLAENTVKTRLHRARLALRKAMMKGAETVAAPAPVYEKQICVDLLKAKMEALDRGGEAAGFCVPQAELCARCRAVFRELDIVQDACAAMAEGRLPERVRKFVLAAAGRGAPVRRGRKTVRRSAAG
jgi:RNA polymerase sigma-70 factor (ECF subfamily)